MHCTPGTIYGTPTTKQTFSFTVEVSDRDSPAQIAEQTYIIDVTDTLSVATRTLPNGRIDVPYTATATAQLGTPPYAWRRASGVLPPSVAFTPSPTVATLTGTAIKAGTYSFELEEGSRSMAMVGLGRPIRQAIRTTRRVSTPGQ